MQTHIVTVHMYTTTTSTDMHTVTAGGASTPTVELMHAFIASNTIYSKYDTSICFIVWTDISRMAYEMSTSDETDGRRKNCNVHIDLGLQL